MTMKGHKGVSPKVLVIVIPVLVVLLLCFIKLAALLQDGMNFGIFSKISELLD